MYTKKVVKAVPMNDMNLLIYFEDGSIKQFDVKSLLPEHPQFDTLRDPAVFARVQVEPGGYGISWNEDLDCSEGELYANGTEVSV